MKDLKNTFEKLGLKEVETYIQSGNVLFVDPSEKTVLNQLIKKSILDDFGFDVPVIIRDANELEFIIRENPFSNYETDKLHISFLDEEPTSNELEPLENIKFESDQFKIVGKNVYLMCEGKYHETKFSNNFFEKKLKKAVTTRNWNTILKLFELSI